jgi:hypothetical protein
VSNKKIEIQVGTETHTVEKAHLKKWLQLTKIYERFLKVNKTSTYSDMAEVIYEYLDVALSQESFDWSKQSWIDTIKCFIAISVLNAPDLVTPMMRVQQSPDKEEPPWEYPERLWYFWATIFASKFGWSLEYIAELEIEDAFGLIQEIQMNDQFELESRWQMTEIAYQYNDATKKSEFKPYPRPDWMLPKVEIKKIPILRSMLPLGVVEDVGKMFTESVIDGNTKP